MHVYVNGLDGLCVLNVCVIVLCAQKFSIIKHRHGAPKKLQTARKKKTFFAEDFRLTGNVKSVIVKFRNDYDVLGHMPENLCPWAQSSEIY